VSAASAEPAAFAAPRRLLPPGWLFGALPLVLGVALAFAGLQLLRTIAFDPNDAGLGTLTKRVFGWPGQTVDCETAALSSPCLTAYRAAGSPPAVIWLGNSQLHGVNRYQPGQSTAPMLLHQALAGKGLYLAAYSPPNANTDEYLALFPALARQYRVQTLVVGVSLDKFRETGVRAGLVDASARPHRGGRTSDDHSLQAASEAWLERMLDANSGFWRDRPTLRSMAIYAIQVGHLRALGITAQTRRPISASLYREKMAALRALVTDARQRGVKVVLYAQPYRSDVSGPTPPKQYRIFLKDLQGLAAPGAVDVMDLTALVPGPDWGLRKDPLYGFEDYDFMHFTAAGHRLLAQAVGQELGVKVP
jgi:hypothetical protein